MDRRSASVSAESAIQSSMEPLLRRALEVLQRVVHAGDVHSGAARGDRSGLPPQRLYLALPAILLLGGVGERGVHTDSFSWNAEAGNSTPLGPQVRASSWGPRPSSA